MSLAEDSDLTSKIHGEVNDLFAAGCIEYNAQRDEVKALDLGKIMVCEEKNNNNSNNHNFLFN